MCVCVGGPARERALSACSCFHVTFFMPEPHTPKRSSSLTENVGYVHLDSSSAHERNAGRGMGGGGRGRFPSLGSGWLSASCGWRWSTPLFIAAINPIQQQFLQNERGGGDRRGGGGVEMHRSGGRAEYIF